MAKLALLVFLGVLGAVIQSSYSHPKNAKCVDASEQCYDRRLHPPSERSTRMTQAPEREDEQEYWLKKAESHVEEKINFKPNKKVAKNIIFFLGDGMSMPTVSAARLLLGGEEKQLAFEHFPHTGLSKTYCLDKMVPDSASTATAYLCGVKGNYGTIGVNGNVKRYDCAAMQNKNYQTPSIAKWAQDAGKATGIVTTTRVTHASPAGNYAHIADRYWENDSNLPPNCPKGLDIASQLVHGDVGSKFKVIFGGGRSEFLNESMVDPEGNAGWRLDGKNLIDEWLNMDSKRQYVFNRRGLLNIDGEKTDTVMGLFQNTHMLYHMQAEKMNLADEKPTLEEMTRKAIEVLQKNKEGYYLFVEGGKIDLAHHDVYAKIALDETVEFSKAIQAAVNMTSEEDTLILVTSDHAHTMSYAGYPYRKNDIYGFPGKIAMDGLPYMTLSYANGNGYSKYMSDATSQRQPFLTTDSEDYMQKFPSTLPIDSETHGGEDVGVYARGPWSHLFTSTYEQNVIPHLLAYAACIGNGLKACD